MTSIYTGSQRVVVIGGGPAGLMAAEVVSQHGLQVDVYDAMPSLGRKLLMAGKSGLNLTHAEDLDVFLSHYAQRRDVMAPIIRRFDPQSLRDWAAQLGIKTFIGSSGRVFPEAMKAAPLLRAWLHRLRKAGVRIHVRQRWTGFDDEGRLRFAGREGESLQAADAVVLALGGGSWPRLGSDAAWVPILEGRGVPVRHLRPANCGFEVDWSDLLRSRYAGAALKNVSLQFSDDQGESLTRQGEFVVTEYGIEGSLVYAFAAVLRDSIERHGHATLQLDLLPALSHAQLRAKLATPRGKRSWSDFLRRRLGLRGVKSALLFESMPREQMHDLDVLAARIKSLPLRCERTRPLEEAISSAGGVAFEGLDQQLMLKMLPGVFCAGEMLDWEAPTGGYLLTACFASGYVAGQGVCSWLARKQHEGGKTGKHIL